MAKESLVELVEEARPSCDCCGKVRELSAETGLCAECDEPEAAQR